MSREWANKYPKMEYGLSPREGFNIPKPQPSKFQEKLGKEGESMAECSQNSVLRSENILASFGSSSYNLFAKPKQMEYQHREEDNLEQTRKKSSSFKSSKFEQLQRKYLPNRKPKHTDALSFLKTLISIMKIHVYKAQREVFIQLENHQERATINDIESQAKNRIDRFESMKMRVDEIQYSEVKPVDEFFSDSRNYHHNDTKIDALADRNLEIEISEVERPSFRDYDYRDLDIVSVTKSDLHSNITDTDKNQAFKFNPKLQKKHLDRKNTEGFSAIINMDSNINSCTQASHCAIHENQKVENRAEVDEKAMRENNRSQFERFEENKKLYNMNPDIFKDSNPDFHQFVMPCETDCLIGSSSEFNEMKMVPMSEEGNVETQNSLSPLAKQKKYSFVNPYMKNIDSDSNDPPLNDRNSEQGIYENFVAEEFNKDSDRGNEISNSFRISDQNSVDSEKMLKAGKRETYTQKNIPKLNEEYFSEHKIKQKIIDRSVQYKVDPKERVYVSPKSNTVGMRNSSCVQISPKRVPPSQCTFNPAHTLEPRDGSFAFNNLEEKGQMKGEGNLKVNSRPQSKIIERSENKNGTIKFGYENNERKKVVSFMQEPVQYGFNHYARPSQIQEFNKPIRASSSGHLTYYQFQNSPKIVLQNQNFKKGFPQSLQTQNRNHNHNEYGNFQVTPAMQQGLHCRNFVSASKLPIQYGVSSPRNQRVEGNRVIGGNTHIYFNNSGGQKKEVYYSPKAKEQIGLNPYSMNQSNNPSEIKAGQETLRASSSKKKIQIFSTLNRKN